MRLLLSRFLFVCLLLASRHCGAATATVNVILWFDTEDYLLPADDDAAKRLAEMLTERGIRATFKVVGEKARVLEQRGRRDVITTLKKHAIGYHANLHSVHPTPTEYLADCGWLDGVAEFARREGGGAADVRRIFGVSTLVCYGQPGSSWAPQAIGALKEIGVANRGIPCYVDEGTHVGLDGKPFWYLGALNVYHMGENYTRMELHDPDAVDPAKRKVSAMADRLRREGGGLISIFYHPCEWVHQEFWDGVNFRRGANPPREQWKAPPQRPPEQTEAAFRRFGEYIDYIRMLPNVHFVTADELPEIYPDSARSQGVSEADLGEIARTLLAGKAVGINFLVTGHRAYSLADQFEVLTRAVARMGTDATPKFPLAVTGLLGPDQPGPTAFPGTQFDRSALRETTRDVLNFLETQHRIPARVFVGADAISPVEFLIILAAAYQSGRSGLSATSAVTIETEPKILPEQHIARDTPQVFGDWIIHREGFRAPKILEQARLRAWTLKPALLRE